MICPCGGQCREHEVIGPPAGWVVTCNSCGRRQLFERQSQPEPAPEQADLLDTSRPESTAEHA